MTDNSLDSGSGATMDKLTDDEFMPEINEAAIAATQAQQEAAIQLEVPQATPVKLNKDGTPRKVRKKKSELNVAAKPSTPETPALTSLQAATAISALLEVASVKLISDEWALSEAERAGNVKAWEGALDHYGGLALSPIGNLAFNHASIIISRSFEPKTQSRYGLFKAWIKDKFSRKKKDARINNRSDAQRQDDIRDEKSA